MRRAQAAPPYTVGDKIHLCINGRAEIVGNFSRRDSREFLSHRDGS